MNFLEINKLFDLQQILNEHFLITGKKSLIEKETYHNMWGITINDSLIKKIQLSDYKEFLSKLLQIRRKQLLQIDPCFTAVFYLWFDKQAMQLRFNFISGCNLSLPFNCKLNMVNSATPILKDFITTIRKYDSEQDIIEFLEPYEDFDNTTEDDLILDVYVELIGSTKNIKY